MKSISKQFQKNGLNLKLLERVGSVVLFKLFNDEGCVYGYEVHKLRLKSYPYGKFNESGVMIRVTKLCLASNEEFGRFAWSYDNFISASSKFNELLEV
ncbi:MAG: hypothetical protein KKB65_01745 [Nanoarchaeota archaeon]|nr:hypothetical protein [Nanoarchaeota archaeon]